MTSILLREEKGTRYRETQGRWSCEDRGKHWDSVVIAMEPPKLEEARMGFPLETSEGMEPC